MYMKSCMLKESGIAMLTVRGDMNKKSEMKFPENKLRKKTAHMNT